MPRIKPDKPTWRPEHKLLHIIAQAAWHDEAFVVGNREGLTRLRDALTAAIDKPGKTQNASVMCSDGEGYHVRVRCEGERSMGLVPFGYTDEFAKPSKDYAWPHWMLA